MRVPRACGRALARAALDGIAAGGNARGAGWGSGNAARGEWSGLVPEWWGGGGACAFASGCLPERDGAGTMGWVGLGWLIWRGGQVGLGSGGRARPGWVPWLWWVGGGQACWWGAAAHGGLPVPAAAAET